MKSFTAGKNEDGARLSRFVENVTSGMPKSLLYKAFRNKRIKVNGKKGAPDTRLCPGDLVELYINDEFFSAAPPTARPLPYKKRPPLAWCTRTKTSPRSTSPPICCAIPTARVT
ncbi:MAG: hypothetical protein ACLRI7_12750 [Ruthenibacterium lactatiformans]